jgi:putative glutamine amidotransferase
MKLSLGYTTLGGNGGISPFNSLFDTPVNLIGKESLKGIDAVVLWGGTDIHPSFYNQKPHPKNQQGELEPQTRDIFEWHLMREAKERGLFIIGVCRGAQFLCTFAGGSLYQHVTGHNTTHEIETFDDKKFFAPADHHQMMNLDNTKYDMLAWSSPRSVLYEREQENISIPGEHITSLEGEPEIVFFEDVNGLAIQPHPEWGRLDSEFNIWLLKTMEGYLK